MSSGDFQKCQCQHCGGRIEFPAQYAGQTIPCPHCQRETKLAAAVPVAVAPAPAVAPSTRARAFKAVAITVAGVLPVVIAGAAFWMVRKQMAERDAQAVQVLNWKMEPAEYRTFYLVGTVTNSSDKLIKNVSVEFNLVDNLGASAGAAAGSKDSLEPHAAWQFKIATSPTQTVWDAKLKGVVVGKK